MRAFLFGASHRLLLSECNDGAPPYHSSLDEGQSSAWSVRKLNEGVPLPSPVQFPTNVIIVTPTTSFLPPEGLGGNQCRLVLLSPKFQAPFAAVLSRGKRKGKKVSPARRPICSRVVYDGQMAHGIPVVNQRSRQPSGGTVLAMKKSHFRDLECEYSSSCSSLARDSGCFISAPAPFSYSKKVEL